MTVRACTVIARNYLAAARVLFETFHASNPGGTLTVLLIDDRSGSFSDDDEPFEVLDIDAIGLDGEEILKMAAIYSIPEFATSVKPWLLQTLIDRFDEPVIYLDPDIMVFEPLDTVRELATEHQLVITPHTTVPYPRDGRRVADSDILESGIYNLGFIAVGTNAGPFLDFWKDRLRRECIFDAPRMRFVDQRFVDFAPAMFDAHILKDSAYNIAYWNLHARTIGYDAVRDRYLVDGRPIVFFHFSGYSPKVPELLSKYQGGTARVLLSEHPELKRLCDRYGELLCAKGYETASKTPYGFARSVDGMKYDDDMRAAYREALIEAEEEGHEPPPNPYADGAAFVAWLNSPVPDGKLSHYLEQIYDQRIDLRLHFPDANGLGINRLISWCWDRSTEGTYDPRLIPPYDTSTAADRPIAAAFGPRDDTTGIQVAGYFKAEMGVGEFGRNTLKMVAASGIRYSTLLDTDVEHRQNLEFTGLEDEGHAVNIVCANADALKHFAYRVGPDYFKERYTVGVWAWELEEFPEEFDYAFDLVDEVWACSEFTRASIATRSTKPVYALPVTLSAPSVAPDFDRAVLGIPDGYLFLFCFDLLSIFERKNPLAPIASFTSAFSPGEGPVLVIKALNGELRLADLERLRIAAQGRDDIVILDEYLDHDHNAGLFDAADCYVSLHRSEGLGFTIAEAMSLGKPVIATAYSGNMDFMNADNSILIPYAYGEVPEGCDPYRPGARWAEPDLAEAAAAMRHVFEHPEEAAAMGRRASEYLRERHRPEATKGFIVERYNAALEALAARQGRLDAGVTDGADGPAKEQTVSEEDPVEATPAQPTLIALASRPVSYENQARFARVSRVLRRVLASLLSNRDAQQRELNLALAMGTEHLARLWNEMQGTLEANRQAMVRTEESVFAMNARVEMLLKMLLEQRACLAGEEDQPDPSAAP